MASAGNCFHRVDELPDRFRAVFPKFKLFNPVNKNSDSDEIPSLCMFMGHDDQLPAPLERAGSKRLFQPQLHE